MVSSLQFERCGRLWIPEAPNLIINRTREVFAEAPAIGFAGYYRAELIRRGRVILDTGWHKNLITDVGLDGVNNTTTATRFAHMGVGTDNTAPNTAQTALGNEIGRTNANGGVNDVLPTWFSGNAYMFSRRTRVFTEGQANGNLTEWGWFTAGTGGTMFARQLFRDEFDAPITITKTSDDQLRITYEWRVYPFAQDSTTITVTNVGSVDCVFRSMGIGNTGTANSAWWGALVQMTSAFAFSQAPSAAAVITCAESVTLPATTAVTLTGTSINSSSGANVGGYTNGNYYREYSGTFEPAVANFGSGVGSFQMGTGSTTGGSNGCARLGSFNFDPKILKDSTKRLVIVFRYTWARV